MTIRRNFAKRMRFSANTIIVWQIINIFTIISSALPLLPFVEVAGANRFIFVPILIFGMLSFMAALKAADKTATADNSRR